MKLIIGSLVPAELKGAIDFPALPDFQRVSWVSRLAVIPPEKALADVTRVESETREFLTGPSDRVFARLQATREAHGQAVDKILQEYWDQLRAHAQAHYVEEREIADIIRMLSERYVETDIQRRQQEQSVDPFSAR